MAGERVAAGRAAQHGARAERGAAGKRNTALTSIFAATLTRLEKDPYLFANWRRATSGTVFFPGCNLPAFFPRTCDAIVALLADAGIGTIYDCCGLAVELVGPQDHARKNVAHIQARLHKAGVTEVVVACANCHEYLSQHLDVPVVFIYEKLAQLGLGTPVVGPGVVHVSCPARRNPKLLEQISAFISNDVTWVNAGCCGLSAAGDAVVQRKCADHVLEAARAAGVGLTSGHAATGTPVAAKRATTVAPAAGEPILYTFCGSCASVFARRQQPEAGDPLEVQHLLSAILGVEEQPATATSLLNRAVRKFR